MVDDLAVVMIDIGVGMLADVCVILLPPRPATVDVLVNVWSGPDINVDISIDECGDWVVDVLINTLTCVSTDATTSVVSDVGVGALTAVSVIMLVVGVIAWEFNVSASLEESMRFC